MQTLQFCNQILTVQLSGHTSERQNLILTLSYAHLLLTNATELKLLYLVPVYSRVRIYKVNLIISIFRSNYK